MHIVSSCLWAKSREAHLLPVGHFDLLVKWVVSHSCKGTSISELGATCEYRARTEVIPELASWCRFYLQLELVNPVLTLAYVIAHETRLIELENGDQTSRKLSNAEMQN